MIGPNTTTPGAPSILLKNGTVLTHDATDTHVVVLTATDVLVENGRITRIEKNIDVAKQQQHEGQSVTVVDCTDKIITPGFTNTHHHLWQTQLRGRHADETLFDYFTSGNVQSNNYTAEDIFWGQLGGAMEAVDGGTTFVLDHAHCCFDEDTASQALTGTITSGIRCLFAYMKPLVKIENWDQEQILLAGGEFPPDLGLDLLERLASKQPFADGRVTMGFSFDQFFLPEDIVKQTFSRVIKAGVQGITSHVVGAPFFGSEGPSAPQSLSKYDLLTTTPNFVLSHCTNLSPEDYALLSKTQTAISCTPETEAQMAHGYPLAFEPGLNVSLGVDCHTNNSSFMPQIARTGLFCARMRTNADLLSQDKFPTNLRGSTEAAFNAMTIDGARAVGLQDHIGSLRVGKKADIVVFDTASSTNMSCVAETDPLVAVVRHSDIRDVDMVIIDGVVRKQNGRLCEVVKTDADGTASGVLSWSDTRKALISSTKAIWERDAKCSHEKGRELHFKVFHTDMRKMARID